MSERLARSMLAGIGLSHPCHNPQFIETHISWLVMVGDFVYKIKKPIDLGFVNFTTLEKRRTCCEAELRLNRRTAPHIYLEVVSIAGTEDQPEIGRHSSENAVPFEYAVKMNRFRSDNILSELAAKGRLSQAIVLKLGEAIAHFHDTIKSEAVDPQFTAITRIKQPVDDNFATLTRIDEVKSDQALLTTLQAWSDAFFEAHNSDFERRSHSGAVRNCHGDLHLANIFYDEGECTLFDCIEFSDELRYIDVANDVAFTIMDLEHHGEPHLAHQLMNEYLQHTGDYDSLSVMVFYLVYRAMVRAKIAAIRLSQNPSMVEHLGADCTHYLELASSFTRPQDRCLIMMCGLSGSGKTTVGRNLSASSGAIHLRSDVERKRLFGLGLTESSRDRGIDIYTEEASERTFAELARLARAISGHGYPVVVDATFINRKERQRFEVLSEDLGIPWAIVECTCDEETTRKRLQDRRGDASEAGFAQYLAQRDRFDAINTREARHHVVVDTTTTSGVSKDALASALLGR